MVTAVASNPKLRSSQNEKRPPLLPTDSDNAPRRRPKGREVSSRYLSLSILSSNSSNSSNTTSSSNTSGSLWSSISSRRSKAPVVSGSAVVTTPKSSVKESVVSVERRRPVVAVAATPSNAERMLMASRRSLSVSFQGESYSLPVSKVKPLPTSVGTTGGLRKGDTPDRRKAGVTPIRDRRERDVEILRPSDKPKQLWPGRLRGENSSVLSRSLDCGSERAKLSELGARLKELRKSVAAPLNSDCESVSSESTASESTIHVREERRGIVVPANSWQEANLYCHKVQDPASPVSNNALNRTTGSSKLGVAKKFLSDSPVSSPRSICSGKGLSPLRVGARAASPSKGLGSSASTLLKGMASPLRCRSGMGNSVNDHKPCSTTWMLCADTDLGRRKSGENRIADAHKLRLFYNRQLQWRLANARLENAMLVHKHSAEIYLYNAWVSTSKLRQSVKSTRMDLLLLRHNLKIYSILKEQEPHLENWYLFDGDNLNSLSGTVVALEASTIRLPVVGGVRVDVHKVREAVTSAVDLMQAMSSSILPSISQLEQMNILVSEFFNLSTRERNLLQECKAFLSTTFIPLQVMHCHLKTHALQVQRLHSRQA